MSADVIYKAIGGFIVVTAKITDDDIVFTIDETIVRHLGFDVLLIDFAHAYYPFFCIHAVLRGEKLGSHGEQILLNGEVVGVLAIFLVELLKTFDFSHRRLRHVEEFLGVHIAHIDGERLTITIDDAQCGEGFHLVVFSDVHILGFLGIELERDKVFVEIFAHLWEGENLFLHLLARATPHSIEIDKEGFSFSLGLGKCLSKGAFEKLDAFGLLCHNRQRD